jgi:hypothetical protein
MTGAPYHLVWVHLLNIGGKVGEIHFTFICYHFFLFNLLR